jgi:FSR family fosmidomycin resistance protein-like MFS transporter
MTATRDQISMSDAASAVRAEERRALTVAGGAHALHDGYTDLVYVMLPIWQAEFGLSYAAVGILRSLFSGTMAGLQIPSGFLAERLGATRVLAAGTALAGFGYLLAGASAGLVMLAVALVVGGIGSSTQHPLASALVARAFAGPRSIKALGMYNFAGDIGKMLVPAAASLLMILLPWRATVAGLGLAGFAAALLILVFAPHPAADAAATRDGKAQAGVAAPRHAFPLLLSIGVLDSATRMGFLTFLPFLLTAKGASVQGVGLALTFVFAGGACGKLVCAYIGARIGVIATVLLTEGLTALLIIALLPLPLEACYLLLPLIGVALNGTSSVLYGSVPVLVAPHKRNRAFGVFYTGTIGSGAIAPVLYGFVGDLIGLVPTLCVIAAVVLATLPLALALRRAFAPHRA